MGVLQKYTDTDKEWDADLVASGETKGTLVHLRYKCSS